MWSQSWPSTKMPSQAYHVQGTQNGTCTVAKSLHLFLFLPWEKKVSTKKTWGAESSCTHSNSTVKHLIEALLYAPTFRWSDWSKRAQDSLIDWPSTGWPLISQLLGQPKLFAIRKSNRTELYLAIPHSLTYTFCSAIERQSNTQPWSYITIQNTPSFGTANCSE